MLTTRYRMQSEDVEDLVSQTFLDCLQASGAGTSDDGLFLVIARRRVSDFWRHRKVELSFKAASKSSLPDREHIDAVLLERALLRFIQGRTELEKTRILEVARAVVQGYSYAEACRSSGIPRGSQGRYREILKAFLAYLARLQSRGHAPTH